MIVFYKYKDDYYYLQEVVEMKNPVTREWEKAVIYISMISGKKYCREEKEFNKLFKLVKD